MDMNDRLVVLHHRRHFDTKGDYIQIGSPFLLSELLAMGFCPQREVVGDLLVDYFTHEVVRNESWLFTWEKLQPTSYARMAIQASLEPISFQMA